MYPSFLYSQGVRILDSSADEPCSRAVGKGHVRKVPRKGYLNVHFVRTGPSDDLNTGDFQQPPIKPYDTALPADNHHSSDLYSAVEE